ncbi:prenyltransferase/squalene oxidase repeat-containing protein [Verrucomicrobiota bacterium]
MKIYFMRNFKISAVIFLSVTVFFLNETVGQDIFTYHGDAVPANIETMYLKGLNWLVNKQNAQGYWEGQYGADPGVVGLAVLAMLAHGEDPNFGPYAQAIKKGLNHILKQANSQNGYIGSSMYNHGFATLALAEAYGSVNDPRLGPALKKAVDLILTSQANNSRGAWRYSPESTDADATVSGAQMVALFAARNAGIGIPEKAIKKGLLFFRQSQSGDGGFGYTGPTGATPPCSAIGALVFTLAKQKNLSEHKSAIRYLKQLNFNNSGSHPYYYKYYAAQAFFHADSKEWKEWNDNNVKQLINTQNPDGSWTSSRGSAFSTSAALLSLALNYRFLPIYER